MAAVGGEEHVAVRTVKVGAATEDGDHARDVAVADVVLAAIGGEAALAIGGEDHVRRVDIGAVLTLREAEGEHRAILEQPDGAHPRGLVVALPDRAEAQDRYLPRVPVGQSVEPEDLVEHGVTSGVPTFASRAVRIARG